MRQQGSKIRAVGEGGSSAARLRVLVVAPSLDILGGQAVQATRLLARLGEEPALEVAFLPINPRLPAPLAQLQKIKYVRTIVTSLLYCCHLLARVPAYDVIHIFSASYFSFLLAPVPALVIAKLCGKKTLLNYHSGEAEDHLRRWPSARSLIRLADRVIVPSGFLVDVFAKFDMRAEAVANIVDTTRYRFRARQPLRPVLLSNRNLEPLYNIACTLRAFQIVQLQRPDARLLVAGIGSERARLTALTSALGLRNVKFLGRVEPERMPELCDQADIFINASDIDNMPNSIIEAFAAGLPVVTTDAGGIPYIVEDERTGLLVPRGDEGRLAAGVLKLLHDDTLAQELIRAAQAECRRYTWAAVRREWLRIYHALAQGKSADRREAIDVHSD